MPRRRKINEEYIQECKDKGYDLPIEDYKGSSIKIKHKCKEGHVYKQRPNHHLNGHGCPKCSRNYSYTPNEYYQECKEKGLDLPIDNYVNSTFKIKHKCSNGHIYEQAPSEHLRGYRCYYCYGNNKKTSEEYYEECKSKRLDLPIEKYINNRTKIKHICSKGHVYEQSPDIHICKGQGCPICNESHGEKFIRNYLDKNHIKYIPQKKFNDLKDKTYLSYDFYLPEYNMLIEYQGIQHFESISFNGMDNSNLEKQQHHDNLKRKYAKDNGYKLLELKYTLGTQEKVNNYLNKTIK